jgi:tetratricopeptide (TPR) repeat protein
MVPEPAPLPRAPSPPPVPPPSTAAVAAPAEEDSLLGAAHVYLSVGKLDLALRAYLSACEAEPVSTEPRLYAGIAHYLSGDLPQALGALRAALLLDHRCWPASYYLGLCYESMGHARDAEREYERAALQSEREQPMNDDPSSPLFGFRRDLAWLAKRRRRSRPAAL